MQIKTIKRWIAPLRRTPLHPQWLIRGVIDAAELRDLQGITLDIGSVGGETARLLAKAAQYIGLDYYDTAVNWYQTRPVLFGDAHAPPLSTASVDNVLMLHVLEHLGRPEQALAEAFRVLRPGGRLLVEEPFLYPLHDAPQHIGRPGETTALLLNLAVACLTLDWLDRRSPLLLLAPLTWLLIPMANLIGWCLGTLQQDSVFMPHRVRIRCRKPTDDGTAAA